MTTWPFPGFGAPVLARSKFWWHSRNGMRFPETFGLRLLVTDVHYIPYFNGTIETKLTTIVLSFPDIEFLSVLNG